MATIETMEGVMEYEEGFGVELVELDQGRILIRAKNEGGCNLVHIDLKQPYNG